MPANAVKTARDEHLWNKAKQLAKKQGHEKDWAYIMGIYQRMGGGGATEKSELPGFAKSGEVAAPFRQVRIPGQVPSQQALEALRLVNAPPQPFTIARLMEHNEPRFSLDAVVKALGFTAQGENYWKGVIGDIIKSSSNELTFRQKLAGKLKEEKIDPALRMALFQRSLRHWRDRFEKSVQIVTVDELLEKAEPRGGTYHKRIPKKGGGYTYVYDPAKYAQREDAHVDGETALHGHIAKRVRDRFERAGHFGLDPAHFEDLVKKHGAKAVAKVLKEHHANGEIVFEKGKMWRPSGGKRLLGQEHLAVKTRASTPTTPKPTLPGSGAQNANASGYKPKV